MTSLFDQTVDSAELREALTCLFESVDAADGDFCGEQREWHLPRLQRASLLMIKLFPLHSARAIEVAKSPYGTGIGGVE